MRHHGKFLLVLAVLTSFFVCAAAASADFKYTGTFSGPGTEPGQLETPGRAAIEQSSGNLFVVDSGNDRIQVFKPNAFGTAEYLTSFGEGELSEPWGIAIAEEGGETYVYVSDAGNERIVKYDSDEAGTPAFTVDPAFTSPVAGSGSGEVGSFMAPLAIDSSTGDLLLADYPNKLVQRFEADGTFVSAFDGTDGGSAFEEPIDLAVNSGGDVYVIDANGPDIAEQEGTSKVLRYSGSGEYKSTLGPVGTHERPATVAVNPVSDEVIVTGDQDSVYEGGPPPYVPALQLFDSADNPLPSPNVDTSAVYDTVSGVAIAAGETADRLYVILDLGHYFGTPYGSLQIQAFRQDTPTAPDVVEQSAVPAYHEATLKALVNPGFADTEYRFEYGPTSLYGNSTPTKTIPAGGKAVAVSAPATGLEPEATYHFRIVVSNSVEEVEGPDQVFTTLAEGTPSGGCANEAIRLAQASSFLPGCRAYEMVSPPDKNSSDIAVTASRLQSTPDGNKITYISTGAFAGAPGTGAVAQYLSARGGEGWTTRALNPFQKTDGLSFFKNSGFKAFDDTLSRAVFIGGEPVLDPAAPPGVRNVYLDEIPTNTFSVLTTKGPEPSAMFPEPYFAAASDDFRHVLFESTVAITPDAPDDGTVKLYESVDGVARLASLLPGDIPAPAGAVAGNGGGSGIQASNNYARRTMSADGSRVIFKDVATGQLYSRVDGTSTLHVSASQRTVPDPAGPLPVVWRGASKDGKRILFSSCEKLTDDSTADAEGCEFGAGSEELYQYDADSGELTVLSGDAEPADGLRAQTRGIIGESDDGFYVYFVAEGRLTPDVPTIVEPHLYLWHAGSVSYVAEFGASDEGQRDQWDQSYQSGIGARVAPDGQHALFSSFASQEGIDNDGGRQIYLYDSSNGELQCVSCGGDGPDGHATLTQASPGVPAGKAEYRNRALLPDGSKAFFSTPRSLVPEDSNGRYDAYEWDSASRRVSLISTGSAPSDSYFVEASADGRDVFIVTRQRLSPRDTDNNIDLYDARSGGGFVEAVPQPSECAGEGCQGDAIPPTPPPGLGSERDSDEGRPAGRLRAARTKRLHGASGFLTVIAPGPGKLKLTGARLETTKKRVAGAGRYRIRIRLGGEGRRRLLRLGSLTVRARIGFVPQGGRRQVAKVKLIFSPPDKPSRGGNRKRVNDMAGGK